MAEKFALTIEKSTNAVVGSWRGSKPNVPVAPPTAKNTVREVTEAVFNDVQSKGMRYPGGSRPRFKLVAGNIVEQADARPEVRFTPVDLTLTRGDPNGSVSAEVMGPGNSVDTSHNATYVVSLGIDAHLRFTFVNGVATVVVRTTRSFNALVDNNPSFRVRAPLEVTVVTDELS